MSDVVAIAFRLLAYLALFMALLYSIQDWLLYLPDRYGQSSLGVLAERNGLQPWPTREDYRAFMVGGAPDRVTATLAVFHGNAGSASDRVYYSQFLDALELRIILLEYPGYGARQGGYGERHFVADGAESLRLILRRYGHPLYVLGESLGAAVATGAIARSGVAVDGLLLCTPWDNLPTLAQALYWFLPVKWLVRDRYDNVANIRSYRGPLGVVMAERDEIVPRESSRKVYESYRGPKRLWVVPGSHNTWLAATGAQWWADVFHFLEQHSGRAPR